ncbi:MAG: ATP-dependent helicase [Deltaproteobacteria bacterium]|nr:MAG: ATP-dependent helicase [Deltaproteobacteria bacterium]
MKKYEVRPETSVTRQKDILAELNESQREAVTHGEGPLLVIAGAGSGKTKTLVCRVAYLVSQGVPPESILLLTFTRKAAEEMLRRAAALSDPRCERVTGGTFHSFANTVLRKYADLIGYDRSFTILDRSDSHDLVGFIREEMGFSSRTVRFPKKETVADIISKSVNKNLTIEDVLTIDYPHFSYLADDIEKIAVRYATLKREKNLMDYDDLLTNLKLLLVEHPDVRRNLSESFRYIMIDEFQDTNRIQAEIAYLVAETHRNIMVVGDDSQSIYSFRGADFRNIMDFPRVYPDAKIVFLEENYRSTQPILDLTNTIISQAAEKYPKKLYTRKGGGNPPWLVATPDEHMQSVFVADRILEIHEDQGVPFSDMAVLFRAAYLSFDLELELAKRNIPYRKFGGFRFMETAHVKDVLSVLRIVVNPQDEISAGRAFRLLEGIGKRKASSLTKILAESGSLEEASRALTEVKRSDDCKSFAELLLSLSRANLPVSEMVGRVVNFYRPIMEKKFDDYPKRLKDLEQLEILAERYRSLNSFLTDVVLEPIESSVADMTATDRETDYLTLSTIHSAKGLEWHTVFIIWVLDGKLPTMKSAEDFAQLEEERRLLYVAATRAKENLFLTYPMNIYDRATQMVLSKPSRFIEGIPRNILPRYTVYEYQDSF